MGMTAGRVEALAGAQVGVLSRVQCLGLGMTSGEIRWMLHSGRWQRVHPGVYVSHAGPLDWRTRVSAALLACGMARLPPMARLLDCWACRTVTPTSLRC